MKRILVGFPEKLIARLSAFCIQKECAMAQVVRDSVRRYLDMQEGEDGDIIDLDSGNDSGNGGGEERQEEEVVSNEKPTQQPTQQPTKQRTTYNPEQIWEDRDYIPVMSNVRDGVCDNHYWDKVRRKTWEVVYEDTEGNIKLDHKWICKECLDKQIYMVREFGGKFISTNGKG